jgi:hypothetical protein
VPALSMAPARLRLWADSCNPRLRSLRA